MATGRPKALIPSAGTNTAVPAEFLDPRESPNNENMEVDRAVVSKRLGTSSFGSSLGERVLGISELASGTSFDVIRVGPTKIEKLTHPSTWSDIASAPWTGTTADLFSFAFPLIAGIKHFIITNGIDPIRKWDGDTATDAVLGGSPPVARFCISYAGYLVLGYISGVTTFFSRVQWSDTGDPETWGTGNSKTLELVEDPEDITGFGVFGDFITVHKKNSIYIGYLVTTSAIFRFDRKNTGVGAVAHATIQNLPTGEQIFLARDGIHLFNGVTAPLIESLIMDDIRDSLSAEFANTSIGVLVIERDEYWCAMPLGDQETPETVYKFNYKTGHVYKDDRENLTAFGLYAKVQQLTWDDKTNSWDSDTTRWNDVVNQANNPTVALGHSDGETTHRDAIYNDDGVAIDALWDSKDFTVADIDSRIPIGTIVRWQALHFWAKGNAVTLYYSIDSGTSWIQISSAEFSLSSDYPTDANPLIGWFDVTSTKIRLRWRNDTAGETFTLKKFFPEGIPREQRR